MWQHGGMERTVLLMAMLACCAKTEPGPTEGELSVLTYNVHGLPALITGDDTNGRMEQIAPLLNDFDVVGAQEDFTDEGHALLDAVATHPYRRRFDDKVDDGRAYGSGLSVFSQFPELDFSQVHYQACNGTIDAASDCLASKGFQTIRLELAAGVELDLYNSHLEAGGGAEDYAAKEVHVDQLIESMNGWSAGRAVVFLGDTNLKDNEEGTPIMSRWLSEAGLSDSCESVECPEPGRIDRILFRDGSGVDVRISEWAVEQQFFDANGVPLSDHDAISATVEWSLTEVL